ncbi:S1 RNA-binding domain-containing protein [Streptomyces sp. NPDC059076]|uniref:S1 RNA-binding domain-containing protein n=1 Tax=unclassified Streptomyces TaxID=2593676 RepID=UPI0036CA73A2
MGAFVRFADGVDGLVHNTELCDEPVDHPGPVVSEGDEHTARIASVVGVVNPPGSMRTLTSAGRALFDFLSSRGAPSGCGRWDRVCWEVWDEFPAGGVCRVHRGRAVASRPSCVDQG